jgi:hypothetical protein
VKQVLYFSPCSCLHLFQRHRERRVAGTFAIKRKTEAEVTSAVLKVQQVQGWLTGKQLPEGGQKLKKKKKIPKPLRSNCRVFIKWDVWCVQYVYNVVKVWIRKEAVTGQTHFFINSTQYLLQRLCIVDMKAIVRAWMWMKLKSHSAYGPQGHYRCELGRDVPPLKPSNGRLFPVPRKITLIDRIFSILHFSRYLL